MVFTLHRQTDRITS